MRIVLEGLTGAGKSQTIAALRGLGLLPGVVIDEEATFGEFMDELGASQERAPSMHLLRRLTATLDRLESERPATFLLERFHLSYYALAPHWKAYDVIDARLAATGAGLALLRIDPALLRDRSLMRTEYANTDWQALAAHYGSEAKALEALARSQERRFDALAKTRLPHRVFDTSGKDWERHAREIAAWAGTSDAD